MFIVAVTYIVREGREAEAIECLKELEIASRQEPGCQMYVAQRANNNPRKFHIYEQYDDEAAFEAHRATEHFQRFGKKGLQEIAESRDAEFYGLLMA
jgi:quinol monooxygenase YgiN